MTETIKLNDGTAIEIDGNNVTITLKVNEQPPLSTSGKSKLLYTSHGWAKLDNGWKVNFGIIKPLR